VALFLSLVRAHAALDQFVALRVDGRAEFEQLGRTVAGVGDVNGDGVPDFAVGLVTAPEGAEGNAISVRVFSGATGMLLWEIPRPANTCEESINSVGGAGDLNGDGRAEFMVGTPRTSRVACGVGDDAGVVRIFNGATGTVFSQRFGNADDLLGWSVAGVGDLNGDGTLDLLVGAPGAGAGAGRVDLVSGTVAGALLASANGAAAGDAFGWSVAAAGDVNADGRADALVGAPFAQGVVGSPGVGAGRAYAYVWLTPGGFTRHHTVMGDGQYDALGSAVAGAGDITADGRADFVVGAPGGVSTDGPVSDGDGYARLYSGSDASVLRTWGGAAPGPGPHHLGDLFGYAVAALGDCDGDGQVEIAVGAPQTGDGHGAVYLFRPNVAAPARIHLGDEAGDLFGVALAAGGDIRAGPPGQQELLVGATGTAVAGNVGAGSAFVLGCLPVPKPDITVSPTEVNFGDAMPGSDQMRPITIRNDGGADLTISSIALGPGASPAITLEPLPALPLVLAPNAASVVTVHFAPPGIGPAGARLDVASNDADEPVVSVPIGGRGVAPEIEVAPGAVVFGDVRVGDWVSALVTIRNVGNAALVVNAVTITVGGDVFSLFPPVAFAAAAPRPVQRVSLTDASILDGRVRFTIQSIDPIGAHRVEEADDLNAGRWVPVPNVVFTSLPGNLIQAEFDWPAEPFRFYRVVDTAPAPLALAAAPDGSFTLAPGEERQLHVLFRPAMVGAAAGILRVESADADEMSIDVPLSGLGVMANQWPVAGIKAEPALPGAAPHRARFLGANRSGDADGMITAYAWDLGDGGNSALADPDHDYAPAAYDLRPGPAARYIARLVVTDNKGASDPTSVAVLVSACPLRSRFYGTVGMLGLPARADAVITARIGAEELAFSRSQRHLGATVYASEVPPIPRTAGCALTREGEEVQFLVDGILAEERGIWHHAWDQELNLHIPLNVGPEWGFDWWSDPRDVRLQFLRGSADDVTIIDFVNLVAPSHPFDHFAGHAFRITARLRDGTPVSRFERPYRLTVAYADSDWQSAGIADEQRLNLYWWNGARWEAILPCANCGLDTAANTLTVELDHLTDFAFGFDQGVAPATTVTLYPVADAYLLSGTPRVNYGAAQTLQIGRDTNGFVGRALFRFDLSAIPAGATVQSASFQAYLLQSSPTPATLPVGLRRIGVPWQEGSVAWATPLNYTVENNVADVGTAMGYSTWNVTSLAQNWVDCRVSDGLALFSQNEGSVGLRSFASRERTAAPSNQPRLIVTYRP
jgi:hypothetical protein